MGYEFDEKAFRRDMPRNLTSPRELLEINSYWNQQDSKSAYDQMNAFRAFTLGSAYSQLSPPPLTDYIPDQTLIGAATMTNAMQMPYTPTATVVQDIVWQANDPLVHYMASDLVNPTTSTFIYSPSRGIIITRMPIISRLNPAADSVPPFCGRQTTLIGRAIWAS